MAICMATLDTDTDPSAARRILAEARSVLLVDWPSPDVPVALTRAGLQVWVKGGPAETDYARREMVGDECVSKPVGRAPDHVDLVYAFRPVGELPGLVGLAQRLGARALWYQSGLAPDGTRDLTGSWLSDGDLIQARTLAREAGLAFIHAERIAAAAGELGPRQSQEGPLTVRYVPR
jgi:predicted CoA-binding protein